MEGMKLAHDRPATLFLYGVHFLSGDSRPVSFLSLCGLSCCGETAALAGSCRLLCPS